MWMGLAFYILKSIFGLLIIIFIPLKKYASILMCKILLAINFLFYLSSVIVVLINNLEISKIISLIILLIAAIANVLVYYRYLNVSKRVKNYFVR
jgi:hypothetical protein